MAQELFEIVIFDRKEVQGSKTSMDKLTNIAVTHRIKFGNIINYHKDETYVYSHSSIAALDCAKVTAENSEFARSFKCDYTTSVEEQTISSTNSDLTVNGCYIHHAVAEEDVLNDSLGGKIKRDLSIFNYFASFYI